MLPWAVAIGAIALILRKYSLAEIAREVARGNTLATIPFALGGFVVTLLLVAIADGIVMRDNLGAPRYRDVIRGKAASVLLFLVHYGVGQGAYAAWIGRKTGGGVGPTAAVMLYIVGAELCSICAFAAIVILAAGPTVPPSLLYAVAGISTVLVLFVLTGPLNLMNADRVVLFRPWTRMKRRRGLAQLAVRVVQHSVGALATALAARAFGLDIPVAVMMAYVPVITVIASLPINVAGVGAVQGAWLLLSPWAPGEQILAFSFVWQLVVSGVLVARGLPFLRGVTREIREGTAKADSEIAPA